jgi:hypothetical protein
MREQLKSLIISGFYKEAKKIFSHMSANEGRDCLLELGYEKESISIYGFLCSALCDKEDAKLHCLASEVLTLPLCHLEGAYATAFYHAKKAVEMDPDDIELKEALLLFNSIPDNLLNEEDAFKLAKDILEKKPYSKVAIDVLKDTM